MSQLMPDDSVQFLVRERIHQRLTQDDRRILGGADGEGIHHVDNSHGRRGGDAEGCGVSRYALRQRMICRQIFYTEKAAHGGLCPCHKPAPEREAQQGQKQPHFDRHTAGIHHVEDKIAGVCASFKKPTDHAAGHDDDEAQHQRRR